jgi:quercetin dioxygenase-like cupin family protein
MTERRDFLPETETKVPIIQPPGGGKVVGVLRDQSTFKVLSEQTNGAYAILEQKIPAGHGPPLHVHRHETEIFYILDGQFEVSIGDQKVPAPPGAIVVGPASGVSQFDTRRLDHCDRRRRALQPRAFRKQGRAQSIALRRHCFAQQM